MKINTLEYIHDLLKKDYELTSDMYKAASRVRDRMQDAPDGAEADDLARQIECVDECWKKRCAAAAALEDFEDQEW